MTDIIHSQPNRENKYDFVIYTSELQAIRRKETTTQ